MWVGAPSGFRVDKDRPAAAGGVRGAILVGARAAEVDGAAVQQHACLWVLGEPHDGPPGRHPHLFALEMDDAALSACGGGGDQGGREQQQGYRGTAHLSPNRSSRGSIRL